MFQNQYKSFLCEEGPYLKELVRYIHLNLVRADMVKTISELNRYRRTGHSAIIGRINRDWQDSDYVLNCFHHEKSIAKKAYLEFVKKGLFQGNRPELVGGGLIRSYGGWAAVKAARKTGDRIISDERILGGNDFVESALKKANEKYAQKTWTKSKGYTIDSLLNSISRYYKIKPSFFRSASRQRRISKIRSIFCYLAVNRLGLSNKEVSEALNMSPSGVSKAVYRGRVEPDAKRIWENTVKDISE